MRHDYAVEVLDYIEASWGEELSPLLAEEIGSANLQMLRQFLDGWPRRDGHGHEAPVISSGTTRPVLGSSWTFEREMRVAPVLLLYVQSISVSGDLIAPHWCLNDEMFQPDEGRAQLVRILKWLSAVKPLVRDGSIYFAANNLSYQDLAWRKEVVSRLAGTRKQHWKGTSLYDLPKRQREIELMTFSQTLVGSIGEVVEQRGTAIALDDIEQRAYDAILGSARTTDGRAAQLARLAEWTLPAIEVAPKDVVAVRSADAFAQWRSSLSEAMGRAAEVPQGEHELRDARAVLAAELETSYLAVGRDLNRSRALSELRTGWRSLAIGGVVGLIQAGLGDIPAGASTAAVGAAGWVDRYLSAKSAKAGDRAIWDTVLSFRDAAR